MSIPRVAIADYHRNHYPTVLGHLPEHGTATVMEACLLWPTAGCDIADHGPIVKVGEPRDGIAQLTGRAVEPYFPELPQLERNGIVADWIKDIEITSSTPARDQSECAGRTRHPD